MSLRLILLVVILALNTVPGFAAELTEEKLRKDLSSDSYRVRWDALEKVANPKAAKFVPVLIEHFKSGKDPINTAQALGKIGPAADEALPALCSLLGEALKDPSPYDSNASLRPTLMDAIAGIKQTPATTEVLRRALKHPSSNVRYEAAHVLGLGGVAAKPAIPDLQALHNDHEWVGLYVYPYGEDVAASAKLAIEALNSPEKKSSREPSR